MALKKPTPVEHPPPSDPSSSDEEVSNEEEDEEEDGDSDESEEDEAPQPKPSTKPSPPPAAEKKKKKKKPHIVIKKSSELKPASPEGSDDGSEDESDSEATPPSPDLSKSVTVAIPAPVVKLGKKRATDGKDYTKNFKKLKEVAVVDDKKTSSAAAGAEDEVKKVGEDAKKQLIQRLFSQEDEIEVLKGILKYSVEKGVDPIQDLTGFHKYVKGAIHVDVSSGQLRAKIRRLRKKYLNASKSKKGVDRNFSRPREQLWYDLSKKIWGAGNAKEVGKAVAAQAVSANGGVDVKGNGKGKRTPKPNMTPDQKEKHASSLQILLSKNEKEHVHHDGSSSALCLAEVIKSKDATGAGLSEEIFKKGLELLGDDVKAKLEEKWKSLVVAEAELYYRRMEIAREQVKLTLDAFKASGH